MCELGAVKSVNKENAQLKMWIIKARATLKELNEELIKVSNEVRKRNTYHFLLRYRREASRFTHAFRVMVYRGEGSSTPTHFIENGQVYTGERGTKKVMYNFYKDLTSKMSDTTAIEEALRKFTHKRVVDKQGDWSQVRRTERLQEQIRVRSVEIMREVTKQTVIDTVMGTANKAANPNDGVGIQMIKQLIYLADIQYDEEDLVGIKCKLHSSRILDNIVELFNCVIKNRHFPPSLNNGVICPLFKQGDSADMANYRPITLLPILYKILTKIINNRMMKLIDGNGAISGVQAGLGGGVNCHTQINTTLNVIKHNHRHSKPLYILSTDVRKAFDTVDFAAFTLTLQNLGYSTEVVDLLNNLQSGFMCSVRSPAGLTDPFEVERGCKQGCPLSPLRFIMVYDIFLRYLEEESKGYKWLLKTQRVNGKRHMNIPGCALADDMLLMCDSEPQFLEMVKEFSEFLTAVGMSLHPDKCHYTTTGVAEPPPVRIPDLTGEEKPVRHVSNNVPFKYLGYHIVPGDCQGRVSEQWSPHNESVLGKISRAIGRLRGSGCKKGEIKHMTNSDVLSVLSYFFYCNYIQNNRRTCQNNRRLQGQDMKRICRIGAQ